MTAIPRLVTPTGRVLDQTAHNSPEWHEQRRQGIGSSDASTIMGRNPWKSRYALWCEKTGKVPPSTFAPSEAAYWGTKLEATVADEAERRLQADDPMVYLSMAPGTIVNCYRDWQRCNIDRLVMVEEESRAVAFVECKTAGINAAKEWRSGEVGQHALWQVIHQMSVTGLDNCYIAALIAGQRFVIEPIKREMHLEDVLLEAEEAFWGLVQADLPPEADGSESTVAVTKNLWPKANPNTTLDLDEDAAVLVAHRRELYEEEKRIKAERDGVEAILRVQMQDYETAVYAGQPVIEWKDHPRTSVDLKALKKAHPDLCKQYEVTQTVRPFRFV